VTTQHVVFDTVPREARAFQGDPAGLVTRVLANVIDLVVVALLLVAGYLAIAGVLFLRRGADFSLPVVSFTTAYWVGFAALVVYFTVTWATTGRTYGDHVLGLRVVRLDGLTVSVWLAGARALLCAIAPLLLVWVAFSRRDRSVQDLIVRTKVIYDWGGTRTGSRSDDPTGVRVDVGPAVTDEPDDRHPEPLPRLDGER
jgi:uncharacterized RDD family membrane protein YckC